MKSFLIFLIVIKIGQKRLYLFKLLNWIEKRRFRCSRIRVRPSRYKLRIISDRYMHFIWWICCIRWKHLESKLKVFIFGTFYTSQIGHVLTSQNWIMTILFGLDLNDEVQHFRTDYNSVPHWLTFTRQIHHWSAFGIEFTLFDRSFYFCQFKLQKWFHRDSLRQLRYLESGRHPRTKTAVCGPSIRPCRQRTEIWTQSFWREINLS